MDEKNVTANDVAHALGIKVAAVYAAYDPKSSVSATRRKIIVSVGTEMGYLPRRDRPKKPPTVKLKKRREFPCTRCTTGVYVIIGPGRPPDLPVCPNCQSIIDEQREKTRGKRKVENIPSVIQDPEALDRLESMISRIKNQDTK